MTDREDLKARIDALTPMGVRFVARLVDSLSTPPAADTTDTWLTDSPEWVESFGLTLAGHHGLTIEPLRLVTFEIAFRDACETADWEVDAAGSATQRFVDTTVVAGDGVERKLSLKSTAAQKLSKTTAHISKLTEAAWIQDVRSAKTRQEHTVELFREYRAAVDSIVMLRAFRSGTTSVPDRYELLEIPSAIFASLEDAPQSAFAADGPRSDAKITVKQIQLSACTVHAVWQISAETN